MNGQPATQLMRVIIAGSRTFIDYGFLCRKLEIIFQRRMPDVVVCGKAAGVDTLGELWAIERRIAVAQYPANWDKYGKRAGPIRNEEMAKNATHLVLFWDGRSPGSKNMLDTAERYQLKIRVIRYGTRDEDAGHSRGEVRKVDGDPAE